MKTNKPILVLTGPTGSGKTSISLEIAKERGDIEIICADSTTVYLGMDIGTDKPSICDDKSLLSNFEFRISNSKNPVIPAKAGIQKTNAEILDSSLRWNDEGVMINGIPHHLLDIVKPDEEFNVSIFLTMVSELVEQIHSRGNIPMLVGGAVMYIDAFVFNYNLPPVAPDEKLREELEQIETEDLFAKLSKLDPDAESTIDANNRRRIIRAIEVWMATGRPLSEQKSKTLLPGNILYLAVEKDREELYANIDKRVDQMFRGGFIEEVKKLLTKYRGSTAMKSAGYKQISDFLDGEITLEEAAVAVKQAHRNYAKRQMTWLRKNPDVIWIDSTESATDKIDKFLKQQ